MCIRDRCNVSLKFSGLIFDNIRMILKIVNRLLECDINCVWPVQIYKIQRHFGFTLSKGIYTLVVIAYSNQEAQK